MVRVLKPGDFTYAHDGHSDWGIQVQTSACGWEGGGGKGDGRKIHNDILAVCARKLVHCSGV